jgi:hypothetical protein
MRHQAQYTINADNSQHKRKNIYGASMKKWSSYAVKSPSEIIHSTSQPMGGDRTYPISQLVPHR